MRKIRRIFLHCSATPEGQDVKMETIREWHVKGNKWKDIGYHYVIELDGEVREGRPVSEMGAHCSGQNADSIGICYVGGMTSDMKKAKDTRTDAQKKSMYELVRKLIKAYGLTLDDVYCHNQFARKACPSFKIDTFKKEYMSYWLR